MIKTLNIQNFKIHKNSTLEFGNLNILTGINSSGKSSVIQSLLLLRQNQQAGQLDKGLELNGDLYDIGLIEDAFCQYADEDYIGFSVTTDKGKNYWWKYAAANRSLKKDFIPVAEHSCDQPADFLSNNFQYISASRWNPRESYPLNTNAVESKRQISQKKGECDLIVHYLYHYGIEKKYQVKEKLKHPNAASTELLDQVSAWEGVISDKVNVHPQMEGKAFVLKYSYNKPNDIVPSKEYNATNVGFGLSYALPIIVVMLTAQPGDLVIIENPEAHLHPQGQSELVRLIAIAAQQGVQIILETHSDHIINGVLIATKQFEEDNKNGIDKQLVKLFYFHKNEDTQTSCIDTINIIGDGKIDKQPTGFFDQTEKDLNYLLGF
ncbi:DUF3696 domain-containing protein [Bacteroides acidifaciens]|uniref:AAA family ATPase n=1 Tax=Bacteroides acidifaciens TaxID=85831 RepID=UPI0025583156|nr:DUF3696 domain-containing protein [Bacteroides acidifaciens]